MTSGDKPECKQYTENGSAPTGGRPFSPLHRPRANKPAHVSGGKATAAHLVRSHNIKLRTAEEQEGDYP